MKINAWKFVELPKKAFYVQIENPFRNAKELFNENCPYSWTTAKGGLYFIGDLKCLRENYEYRVVDFGTIGRDIQVSLLTSFFSDSFIQKGFTYIKQIGSFFMGKNNPQLAPRFSKESNLFVNTGFKFSIVIYNNRLIFLLNPLQITTEDGLKYDPEFSKSNNGTVLSDHKVKPSYKNLCDMFNSLVQFLFESNDVVNINFFDSGNAQLESSKNIEAKILSEPEIDFGNGKMAQWPKLGISKYHPLDYNEGQSSRPDCVKIALFGSKNSFDMLNSLKNGQSEGKYAFLGFDKIYKSTLEMGKTRFIAPTDKEINDVRSSTDISDLVISKIVALKNQGIDFDVYLIELLPEWEPYFTMQEKDLHDLIKVKAWKYQIRTQIFTDKSYAQDNSDTLNNLALGIYFKSGGNPWRVASKFINTAYIGISFGYSITDKKRLVGVAEIFDCYGQFVAIRSITIKEAYLDQVIKEKRDIHLQKEQMEGLIVALLTDYYTFMDNTFPDSLVIHKTTYFNKYEKLAIENLSAYPVMISLVYAQKSSNWNIINEIPIEPTRGTYYIEPTRGTYFKINSNSALIYTSGIMQGQSKYFLPGSPRPYLIHLENESNFELEELLTQIMELSKLNFNSTNTYSKHPVTLLHARNIVDLLRVGLDSNDIPTDPRFFL